MYDIQEINKPFEKRIFIDQQLKEILIYDCLCDSFAQTIKLYDPNKNESYADIFSSIGIFILKKETPFELFFKLSLDVSKDDLNLIINKDIKLIKQNPPIISNDQKNDINNNNNNSNLYEKSNAPLVINLCSGFFSNKKFLKIIKISNVDQRFIQFKLKITKALNSNKPFSEDEIKNSLKHWVEQLKFNRKIVIVGYSNEQKNDMLLLKNQIPIEKKQKNLKRPERINTTINNTPVNDNPLNIRIPTVKSTPFKGKTAKKKISKKIVNPKNAPSIIKFLKPINQIDK